MKKRRNNDEEEILKARLKEMEERGEVISPKELIPLLSSLRRTVLNVLNQVDLLSEKLGINEAIIREE